MDNIQEVKSEFPANTKGSIDKPVLVSNKSIHDFGTINGDINNSYDFILTNNSTRNVIIISAHASCGCTQPTYEHGKVIMPGETTIITANYKAAKKGNFHKFINVNYNFEVIHVNKALTKEQKKLTEQTIRLDIQGIAN
jgi:hypothetical protein